MKTSGETPHSSLLTPRSAPLTVYKASAGSGKTFTLAVEYIKLLISDPNNFRYTLAVTFTNKATQEMKQRILSKLYGIAHSLPDSDDYFKQVKSAFPNLNERTIRDRTDKALALLVHNYSFFRVETIDSFFQRVLRNLARELGLTANLQVSLNDNEVESQAVDNIVEDIDSENDPLLSWIMDFVQERMDDDKSWNVIGQIKDFGRNIFTDFYKDHQEELRKLMDDGAFFAKYKQSLYALKAKANKDMAEFAGRYYAIAAHYGLNDDCFLRGHSNAPGYFEKLASGDYLGKKTEIPNKTVASGIADPAKLVKKAYVGKPEGEAIINEVAPLLADAEEARRKAAVTVNSVELTLQNVNQLRLLGRIEQEVSRINTENNDYPLSNTQKLLGSLIDRQDLPFIYEKIGGQLRFIMIDEFQDTSVTQWENFKVLLDDCIAHQAGSLIVGDVKQSIYRWRNGDWRLLQGLSEANYPTMLSVKHLDTNYRSQRNIVEFNNAFFRIAAKLTAGHAIEELQASPASSPTMPTANAEGSSRLAAEAMAIAEAYADVEQKVPDKKPRAGLVSISLLPKDEYDDAMVAKVKETIEYLLSNGIPQNKIAVIVRKNKHIKLLADYFLHNPVNVNGKETMINMVSDEAFRLDASLAVNVMVKSLYWLTHPDDSLVTAFLAKAYQTITNGKPLFDNNENIEKLLPNGMTAGRAALLSMPLIDLAERLYNIFNLYRLNDQGAYVCAFFDQLSAYLKKHAADINDFLEEWNETLCAKSIHSDEINGVRMLTVHKSKGLEYDNVIMPFCDWDLEDSRDILWAEPHVEPYRQLPVVPLHIQAKKMKQSIYAGDYESEHIKNLVDNLNILYVAFTRASRNLFVFGKKEGAKYPSEIIKETLENISLAIPPMDDAETDALNFQYGSLCLSDDVQASATDNEERHTKSLNIFDQKEQGIYIGTGYAQPNAGAAPVAVSTAPVFMQSNASTDFMTPDDELDEKEKRKEYISTGNILHALFASIHNYNEIDKAIDELEFDGVLYEKPMTRSQLRAYIEQELSLPQIKDWFSPRWQVFNECSILYYDEADGHVREQRPDRVIYDGKQMIVIDFKTGRELEKHKTQVRSYMRLLADMGYKNISGCLWYIRHNEVVEV